MTSERICERCGEPEPVNAASFPYERIQGYVTGETTRSLHLKCWTAESKEREAKDYNQQPIVVRVINFKTGLKAARTLGGHYNGITKTWAIPAGTVDVSTLRQRGLELVDGAAPAGIEWRQGERCPSYTRDEGCPMHGELCAPVYAGPTRGLRRA